MAEERHVKVVRRVVARYPDGRYYWQGFDCADRRVKSPLDATDFSGYCYLDQTDRPDDTALVEFEVTTTCVPTGRGEGHLYVEGRLVDG